MIELDYEGKQYRVDLNAQGKTIRIRVVYVRYHRQQRLGVLRTIFPLKAKSASTIIAGVSTKAEALWMSNQK